MRWPSAKMDPWIVYDMYRGLRHLIWHTAAFSRINSMTYVMYRCLAAGIPLTFQSHLPSGIIERHYFQFINKLVLQSVAHLYPVGQIEVVIRETAVWVMVTRPMKNESLSFFIYLVYYTH